MSKVSKKTIIIFIVLIISLIIGIIYYVCYISKIRNIAFDNIKEIYVNYYSYKDSKEPIVRIELTENEEEILLTMLKESKFIEKGNTIDKMHNYEVYLKDDMKFTFQYERTVASYFDNNTETIVDWYIGKEVFSTKMSLSIINRIIDIVDRKLTQDTLMFSSEKVTIQIENDIIEIEGAHRRIFIDSTKEFVEVKEIPEKEIKYIVDFHNYNGTKIEIYGDLNADLYGKILVNGEWYKNVKIPFDMKSEIYDKVEERK